VYAPGFVLIAKYFDRGHEGFATGLFGAAALVGNIMALLVDSVLPTYIGWRQTLVLNAVYGFGITIVLLLIPEVEKSEPKSALGTESENNQISFRAIRSILLDRWILAICSVVLSLEIGSVVASNFMIYYMQTELGVTPAISGIVSSLIPACGLVASLLFGRTFDRIGKPRGLLVLSGIITALGLAIAAYGTVLSAGLSSLAVGFGNNAGYIVGLAVATRIAYHGEKKYEVLGIAWILSVSLLGSFFAPILFSYLAISFGYPVAWLGLSAIMFIFLIPILVVKSEKIGMRQLKSP